MIKIKLHPWTTHYNISGSCATAANEMLISVEWDADWGKNYSGAHFSFQQSLSQRTQFKSFPIVRFLSRFRRMECHRQTEKGCWRQGGVLITEKKLRLNKEGKKIVSLKMWNSPWRLSWWWDTTRLSRGWVRKVRKAHPGRNLSQKKSFFFFLSADTSWMQKPSPLPQTQQALKKACLEPMQQVSSSPLIAAQLKQYEYEIISYLFFKC